MITQIERQRIGEWNFMSGLGSVSGEFVAWCKRGEFKTECPCAEPGDVWFGMGRTRAEAIEKLNKEVLSFEQEH